MNTNNVKKYAPKARKAFIEAMSKQAAKYGITKKKIEPAEQKGDLVLIGDRPFPASIIKPRERLVKRIKQQGFDQVMEHVAYSWFNRLCAIRYMERKGFLDHGRRVLSAADGSAGVPQILEECLDVDLPGLDQAKVRELKLDGTKDEELYRELLLAQCHALHQAMPFLFEAVADESELLLPENLTKTDSLIRDLVASVPDEDWDHIEIIGWLYQFYISEKKDQVMGKVVKSEDIPAATQLFTPNWIVQYLVQNSVGRQWLQTYPNSPLKEKMPYYIEPAEQTPEVQAELAAIVPKELKPETLSCIDPAVGSGHLLIEAYKVFKAIYEERGYRTRDIPQLILENNLFGLDIDDRAGQLAGFALMMLAREDDRRIFSRNIRLNVLSLQESSNVNLSSLWRSLNLTGEWQSGTSQGLFEEQQQDLISADKRYQLLQRTLERFKQAKTFGSLIDVPHDDYEGLNETFITLCELESSGDLMQKAAASQLISYVHQAILLANRYDAVVANPPYMGSKLYNTNLKEYVGEHYSLSKHDLFTCFMERALKLNLYGGYSALITIPNWMSLTSFSGFRDFLYENSTVCSLINNGRGLWGADFGSCAFVLKSFKCENYFGLYKKLYDKASIVGSVESIKEQFFVRSAFIKSISSFARIPTKPLAFWLEENILDVYKDYFVLKEVGDTRQGMATSDNDRFLRFWWECDTEKTEHPGKDVEAYKASPRKWMPYNKGGAYKKWYGNQEYVVNWEKNGEEILALAASKYGSPTRTVKSISEYFKPSISWSKVTIGDFSIRYYPSGFIFDVAGCSIFATSQDVLKRLMGVLNTRFAKDILSLTSQSVNYETGTLANFPVNRRVLESEVLLSLVDECISVSKELFLFEETSRDFLRLFNKQEETSAADSFSGLETKVSSKHENLRSLEKKISDTVNELYAVNYTNSAPVVLEQKISIVEITTKLLSYSIGCIMGRYSLDRDGVVYAHCGNNGFEEMVAEGAYKTFPADDDGIIPLTDQEWFPDDATNRFREFVKVVWSEVHLQENLDFVAESLCLHAIKPKKSESAMDTIRRYLSTQFYKDHLKTYKKRPIYWLFSSGKQKAFECLVYLHRYNEGTLARMRTEYVIPLTAKMAAYAQKLENDKEASGSAAEVKRLEKEIAQLHKQQAELSEFDEKLRHYADQRISLDLDDGVKANYGKFGDLLAEVKAITGEAPEALS